MKTSQANRAIGAYLKSARETQGLTQLEVSKKLGHSESAQLSRIESGKEKLPLKAYSILIEELEIEPKVMLALYLTYCTEKFKGALK